MHPWGTEPYVALLAVFYYPLAVFDNKSPSKLQHDASQNGTRDPITHLPAPMAFHPFTFPFFSYLSSRALGQRLLTLGRHYAATCSIPIIVTPRSPLYNTYSILSEK